MPDAMETLKNILGDGAEDKIKSVMGSLSQPADTNNTSGSVNMDSLEQMMQIKGIIDSMTNSRNDPRANLLLSLKPYMRSGRQRSIDTAVKLLGVSKITKLIGR